MIIPERPAFTLTGYDPAKRGCTGCGSPDTVTVDGHNGRRCADCAPRFDATRAVELMTVDPAAAADYVWGVGA